METTKKLIKAKNYNIAGVTSAIIAILSYKLGKLDSFKSFLINVASPDSIFYETLPVKLCEFIINLNEINETDIIIDSFELMKNLPLFETEVTLLNEITGEEEQDETEEAKETKYDKKELLSEVVKLGKIIEKEKRDISKRKMMKRRFWQDIFTQIRNNNHQSLSEEYLKVSKILFEKNLNKSAIISLIMSLLIKIAKNENEESKKTFFNILNYYEEQMKDFPEVQLIPYIFKAIDYDFDDLFMKIITIYKEELILFPPEITLINQLFEGPKEVPKEEEIKKKDETSELMVELEQKISTIELKFEEKREEFEKFFKKRKIMKKRYYQDILGKLGEGNFQKAGREYLQLAKRFRERKDMKTSNFLILLYGLSLFKAKIPVLEIEKEIEQYLTELGAAKRLVVDTFEIMLLIFLIEIKKKELIRYNKKLTNLLNELPLFEEEKQLINIEFIHNNFY
jgi:hypothetical protein